MNNKRKKKKKRCLFFFYQRFQGSRATEFPLIAQHLGAQMLVSGLTGYRFSEWPLYEGKKKITCHLVHKNET